MPITCAPYDDSPLCRGHNWIVVDDQKLAWVLARVASGYYLHVQRIIKDSSLKLPSLKSNSLDRLVQRLGTPANQELRYHRDGWVFQMISWIAAHLTSPATVLIAPPQPRPADKGFDGLIIEIDATDDALTQVVICEDKASEDARGVVRDKVWPELRDLEAGQRDAELQCEVTALLAGRSEDLLKIVEAIHWDDRRKYRVSVTITEQEAVNGGRARIFKGFNVEVPGDCSRRQAETIVLGQLRPWMDSLCAKIVHELKQMEA